MEKHGHAKRGATTKTYETWMNMNGRCKTTTRHNYALYGGRGITVCERWSAFENFVADMGERPDGMTLDRINNDLGYSPDNCRWAPTKEQQRNLRNNVNVEFNGRSQCVRAWEEELGMKSGVLGYRIRRGWGIAAFTTPVKYGNRVVKTKTTLSRGHA